MNLKGTARGNSPFWCMLNYIVSAMHRNEVEKILNYEGEERVIWSLYDVEYPTAKKQVKVKG